jgi:hypothetical protein
MRYNWNKDLKPNQNLKTFGSALSYFKECMDELILQFNGQLSNLGNLMNSIADHRIYIGAADRTQYSISVLKYLLRRYCSYDGQHRPDILIIGKDPNIPINDPNIDVGIVASGTSFSETAVNAMNVLTDGNVKTFFLTYTTPEKAKEEQEKQKQQGKKPMPSVWDRFVEQKDYKDRVIYFPMTEESWRRERKRASLAPLGAKFEESITAASVAIADGIRFYHSNNGKNKTNETDRKSVV